MALELVLHLLDVDAYRERVLPAYHAFVERRDGSGLAALLRVAARALPTEAQRDALSSARSAVLRRALPGSGGSPFDLPAVLGMVEDELARLSPLGPGWMSSEEAVAAADVLEREREGDRDAAPAERVRGAVVGVILEALCIPWAIGFAPMLSLRRAAVRGLVPEGARWLEGVLDGGGLTGPSLELSIAEGTTLFSAADLDRLDRELAALPAQEGSPRARAELEQLRAMVRKAREAPRFALAVAYAT